MLRVFGVRPAGKRQRGLPEHNECLGCQPNVSQDIVQATLFSLHPLSFCHPANCTPLKGADEGTVRIQLTNDLLTYVARCAVLSCFFAKVMCRGIVRPSHRARGPLSATAGLAFGQPPHLVLASGPPRLWCPHALAHAPRVRSHGHTQQQCLISRAAAGPHRSPAHVISGFHSGR